MIFHGKLRNHQRVCGMSHQKLAQRINWPGLRFQGRQGRHDSPELLLIQMSIDWFCWEKLQENTILHGKIYGFL